jgi:hypothetical protein
MNPAPYHAKYYAYELTRRCPPDSVEKLAGQKQAKALETQRNTKRRALLDAQDEIDVQRERLVAEMEGELQQRTSLSALFTTG